MFWGLDCKDALLFIWYLIDLGFIITILKLDNIMKKVDVYISNKLTSCKVWNRLASSSMQKWPFVTNGCKYTINTCACAWMAITRVCGITHSVSARRWEGDGFDAWPKGRTIKGLVVCNNWDLDPLDLLNGLALGYYPPSPEVLIVYI